MRSIPANEYLNSAYEVLHDEAKGKLKLEDPIHENQENAIKNLRSNFTLPLSRINIVFTEENVNYAGFYVNGENVVHVTEQSVIGQNRDWLRHVVQHEANHLNNKGEHVDTNQLPNQEHREIFFEYFGHKPDQTYFTEMLTELATMQDLGKSETPSGYKNEVADGKNLYKDIYKINHKKITEAFKNLDTDPQTFYSILAEFTTYLLIQKEAKRYSNIIDNTETITQEWLKNPKVLEKKEDISNFARKIAFETLQKQSQDKRDEDNQKAQRLFISLYDSSEEYNMAA